jgi:hypothetical protein
VFAQEVQNDTDPAEFDISYLPSRTYLLRILIGNENITKKLIKISHR